MTLFDVAPVPRLTDAHVEPRSCVAGLASDGAAVRGEGVFAQPVVRHGGSQLAGATANKHGLRVHACRQRRDGRFEKEQDRLRRHLLL